MSIYIQISKLSSDDYQSREVSDYSGEIAAEITAKGGITANYDGGCQNAACSCKSSSHKKIWWWELDSCGAVIENVTYNPYPVLE